MLRVFLRHVAQSLQNGAEDDLSVVLLLRGERFRAALPEIIRRGFVRAKPVGTRPAALSMALAQVVMRVLTAAQTISRPLSA